MKTGFTVAFVMVLAMVLFVGCPAVNTPNICPITNTDNPDPTVGIDNPTKPGDKYTGGIVIKGNMFATTKSATTSEDATIVDMMLALKGMATKLTVAVYQPGGYGKGGGGSNLYNYHFDIPIATNGQFEGHCGGIFHGTYQIDVNFLDVDGVYLFNGSINGVKVEPKIETVVYVTAKPMQVYPFIFSIKDLPGEYTNTASDYKMLLDGRYGCGWQIKDKQLEITAYLPLDFVGGVLTLSDDKGQGYSTEVPLTISQLDWSTMQLSTCMIFDYVPLGGIDLTVRIDAPYVLGNGKNFGSIQEAIDACESPVVVTVGNGEYKGQINIPATKSVTINGNGADTTILSNPGNVIYFPNFGGEANAGNILKLYNLQVVSEYGIGNGAIFTDGIGLEMNNCVVHSKSGITMVTTNYDQAVTISHCTIVGSDWGNGIATYFEQGVSITDSIVINVTTGFLYHNGDAKISNSFFWNVNKLTLQENTGIYDALPVDTSVRYNTADPLVGPDFRLLPGSPCIGTATDGADVGTTFKG
ncbi:MAG: hypothetical protein WCP18_02645 [bacterium]